MPVSGRTLKNIAENKKRKRERNMAKTVFQVFLDQEVNKVKGVYYPVKAGFPRRLLIKRVSCKKLHPNPEDEFCFPGDRAEL